MENVSTGTSNFGRPERLRQHRSGYGGARSIRLHFGDLRFLEGADAAQSGQAALRGCAGVSRCRLGDHPDWCPGHIGSFGLLVAKSLATSLYFIRGCYGRGDLWRKAHRHLPRR